MKRPLVSSQVGRGDNLRRVALVTLLNFAGISKHVFGISTSYGMSGVEGISLLQQCKCLLTNQW